MSLCAQKPYGISATLVLAIDGKVVSMGKVLEVDAIEKLISGDSTDIISSCDCGCWANQASYESRLEAMPSVVCAA